MHMDEDWPCRCIASLAIHQRSLLTSPVLVTYLALHDKKSCQKTFVSIFLLSTVTVRPPNVYGRREDVENI